MLEMFFDLVKDYRVFLRPSGPSEIPCSIEVGKVTKTVPIILALFNYTFVFFFNDWFINSSTKFDGKNKR